MKKGNDTIQNSIVNAMSSLSPKENIFYAVSGKSEIVQSMTGKIENILNTLCAKSEKVPAPMGLFNGINMFSQLLFAKS